MSTSSSVFPPEIFALIICQLSLSSRKHLCATSLVSRCFRDLSQAILYEKIKFRTTSLNSDNKPHASRGWSFHVLLNQNPNLGHHVQTLHLDTCIGFCHGDHEWVLTIPLLLPNLRTLRLTGISSPCAAMVMALERFLKLPSLEMVSFWTTHMFPAHFLALCIGVRQLEICGVPFGTRPEEQGLLLRVMSDRDSSRKTFTSPSNDSGEVPRLESLILPVAEVNAPQLIGQWPAFQLSRLTVFATSARGNKAMPFIQNILDLSAMTLQEVDITLPNVALGTEGDPPLTLARLEVLECLTLGTHTVSGSSGLLLNPNTCEILDTLPKISRLQTVTLDLSMIGSQLEIIPVTINTDDWQRADDILSQLENHLGREQHVVVVLAKSLGTKDLECLWEEQIGYLLWKLGKSGRLITVPRRKGPRANCFATKYV
ncbi:hypothetical protein E4T56_gene13804 [Termitomyces sp. T112]|nr:hypothetical protein E4T56_gene13804 [Termitomyces sp. T112]